MIITGSIVTIRQSATFSSSSVNTSGSSGSLPDLVASGSTGSYVTVPTSDDLYILWATNTAGTGSAVSASIDIDSMGKGQVITICLPVRNNVPNVHLQDPTATSSSSGITNAILGGLGETEAVGYRDWETDRKSTRLNSSHSRASRMPSSA